MTAPLDAAARQVLARQLLNIKAQCDAMLETLGVVVVQDPGRTPLPVAVAPASTTGPMPPRGKTYFGAKPEETPHGKEKPKGR